MGSTWGLRNFIERCKGGSPSNKCAGAAYVRRRQFVLPPDVLRLNLERIAGEHKIP
jgi:hypothetical protein